MKIAYWKSYLAGALTGVVFILLIYSVALLRRLTSQE